MEVGVCQGLEGGKGKDIKIQVWRHTLVIPEDGDKMDGGSLEPPGQPG